MQHTGSSDTEFLYNAQYGVLSDPNGLIHMRARYYNPYLRRFQNADPIGFDGGLNWFAYANGNPIIYLDPSGLDAASSAGGGFNQIGSGILDLGQTSIGMVGLVPAFGNPADLLNASISAARGNYVDALIDGASATPAAGQIAGGAAIVNRGGRGIGKIVDGVKSLFTANNPKLLKSLADSTVDDALRAGSQLDRNGLSVAGRALQKHGDRAGSAFPASTGNAVARNTQGQQVLEGILRSPQQTVKSNRFGGQDIFDSATGLGVRFDGNGNTMGFLEP